MASFEDLNKTVSEIFCLLCIGNPRPGKRQWYQCLNLHHVCQECKEKKMCFCGEPISKEYCKIIEQLLSVKGLKFKCINTKNGCQEDFVENDALKEHESECIYRQVPCIAYWCDAEPAIHDLIKHYETKHNDYEEIPVQDLSKMVTGLYFFWDVSMCTLNNQTFVFCHKYDDLVHKWVYILGSPNEAKQYAYTLKLIGKETKISFEGKVAAIDEPFETLKLEKCLTIPYDVFEAQFVNMENDEYKYSLEIRYLKEEAKDENNESGISDNDEDSKQ